MATKHPGAAIRRARRSIEMLQGDLASCIGRSPSYLCNFELGRISARPEEVVAMRAAIKARQSARNSA